jgi:hypothetical protein
MPTLTPRDTLEFAEAVYGIREMSDVERGFQRRLDGHGLSANWDLGSARSMEGVSGPISRSRSGFAAVVRGTGGRSTETVVVTRGTQTGADWGSNLRATYDTGPGGLVVHKGFHDIFKSIRAAVFSNLGSIPSTNRQTIHCVGHSLGGALANFMANYIHREFRADVKLYTFGSPRAGDAFFARDTTNRLGANNIFRVYNFNDPVPMVPLFPFLHAPHSSDGIRVGGTSLGVSVDDHVMPTGYMSKIAHNATWQLLRRSGAQIESPWSAATWLEYIGENMRIPGASWGLWALGKALDALITLAVGTLGLAVHGTATLIDRLAMMLHRAAELSQRIGSSIVRFMQLVLRWAGRTVAEGAVHMTRAFLTYVLGLLLRPLVAAANSALRRIA